jgi:hypothetical protein
MCWSGEASAVLAIIGIASTVYTWWKKEPPVLCLALGYFSLMELLQAFTYAVIDDCSNPLNQIATLLGYLHIAFQPFFINMVSLYFVRYKLPGFAKPLIYTCCFAATIMMLIQLYPFSWAGTCLPNRPLCGEVLCSFSGQWHIAWSVPTNGIGNSLAQISWLSPAFAFLGFVLVAFLLPLFYGSWKFTIYHYLIGPGLARVLTDNLNERPAIWCLFSLALLLIVIKTPIRKILYVDKWYFKRYTAND